jgi:eukaryotic-like serine/threonine-protein kinase
LCGEASSCLRETQIEACRAGQETGIVAVKLLSGKETGCQTTLARFQQEVKISSCLNHPNIARIFGCGLTGQGEPYLLLEYIEGTTLAQEIGEKAPLTFGRFRQIFLALLAALEHAHNAGPEASWRK